MYLAVLLQQALLDCKFDISRILRGWIDPPISDGDAFQSHRYSGRFQKRIRYLSIVPVNEFILAHKMTQNAYQCREYIVLQSSRPPDRSADIALD